jgi:hypothetical protein
VNPGSVLRKTPGLNTWRAAPVLLLLVAACSPPRAAAPPWPGSAEYAFRWDPAGGGPRTPQDVLALLDLPVPTPEKYEVRYWDLPSPASAPLSATPIFRERTKAGGKTEFRLKYRFSRPLATAWACPAGEAFHPEEQVDVSVGEGGNAVRVYSYSCTLKTGAPPSSLNAVPKSCSVSMTRYNAEGLRVEEWRMPDGARTIEVSRAAADSVDELESFRQVAEKLLAKGAKASDRSKTELGSTCP